LLHESEFVHAVCEHGERVHVETVATVDCGAHGDATLPLAERGVPSRHAGAHEHCSLAPSDAPARQPGPGSALVRPWVARATLAAAAPAPRAERVPRYLLAPHHSPPLG
jgi:hypothetical protein